MTAMNEITCSGEEMEIMDGKRCYYIAYNANSIYENGRYFVTIDYCDVYLNGAKKMVSFDKFPWQIRDPIYEYIEEKTAGNW